jgi:hypothetical protein
MTTQLALLENMVCFSIALRELVQEMQENSEFYGSLGHFADVFLESDLVT